MPYLTRDGVKLYYEVHGEHGRTPLLLSHGFSYTSIMWSGQLAALSKDFTLITWDMRGHGRSDYPSDDSLYSEAHTVADMLALLRHVCGASAPPAVVGGLSLGGYMTLAFHATHPDWCRALLLVDTGPGFRDDGAREGWNQVARGTGTDLEQNGLASTYITGSGPRAEACGTTSHRNATGLARAARGMLAQRDGGVIASLPGVRVPCLVVVGEDDEPYLPAAAYMARKIPGAEKAVVPKAGHAVNVDNPDGFLEAVLPWLQKVGGGRAKI